MLTRVFQDVKTSNTWKPRVEEHTFRNGERFYSFRDRFGRPFDVTKEEAEQIVNEWGMVDVTEEWEAEGWISNV